MIQKVRIARREKSELEKWLSEIDPNWRGKNLYQWSYGGDNQTTLTPHDVYDLEGFNKLQMGPITKYQKGNHFLIEIIQNPFTNVLTNIKPSTDKWNYNLKQKAKKVVLGQDKLI